jgi:hypothetical protein
VELRSIGWHVGRGCFVGRSISRGRLVGGSRGIGGSRSISRSRSIGRGSLVGGGRGISRSRSVGRSGSISRSRSVGRLAVSRVGSLSSIRNISHVAAVGIIHLVVDGLGPAVRKSHRVGAGGGIAVTVLTSAELVAIVVIHSVVVGIDCRPIIGRLLVSRVGWCRGISRCRGIGRCRSIPILGRIRCRSSSSHGGQSKSDESLKNCVYFYFFIFFYFKRVL